jgi:hypothetical protein
MYIIYMNIYISFPFSLNSASVQGDYGEAGMEDRIIESE